MDYNSLRFEVLIKTFIIIIAFGISVFPGNKGGSSRKKYGGISAKINNSAKSDSSGSSAGTLTSQSSGYQDTSGAYYLPKWYSMITNLPGDMVGFYNKEITTSNIPIFLGISAATAGLILTDNATWKEAHKFYTRNSFNKRWSDIIVKIGDGSSQFGLAGGFAVFGFITGNRRALRTASEIVEAVLASGAVVQLLKHITGRESPFVSTKPAGDWRFFPNQIDYLKHVPAYDAFPSGHMTTSLAAFIVIAENYPEFKWIKPVSYSLEVLLGISMVNTGIHWYSDYPLAIFLGYSFGELISHPVINNKDSNSKGSNVELNISPYFNDRSSGISFNLLF